MKWIILILSSSHNALPTLGVASRLVGITFSTPSGRPARVKIWPIATAEQAASGDGLRTIVQPAARAATALRHGMTKGKFHLVEPFVNIWIVSSMRTHGHISATGPMGSLVVKYRMEALPTSALLMLSPLNRSASPAMTKEYEADGRRTSTQSNMTNATETHSKCSVSSAPHPVHQEGLTALLHLTRGFPQRSCPSPSP